MNRVEIQAEMNRLQKLGIIGETLRTMCMENLAIRWSMCSDEVADVFSAEGF
jgi:hypothetical protein